MQEKFLQENLIPKPETSTFKLGEKEFIFNKFNIGQSPEGGVISPGNMETGDPNEIQKLHEKNPLMINNFLEGADFVPYSFLYEDNKKTYGDYTTSVGQDEFKNSDLALTEDTFSPPKWIQELWDFAKLKKLKSFTTDNTLACLRGLKIKDNKTTFTLGAGLYSDSFYSNGLDGVTIELTSADKTSLSLLGVPDIEIKRLEDMTKSLEKKYGSGRSIRDIIISQYGHLPEFDEHIYNNSIGVAGMVLTRDNEFVFVNRQNNVSVNQGINCTASGAAEFDKDTLSQYGIQTFLGKEMSREANEELGIKAGTLIIGSMKQRIKLELGLNDNEYELIPVGFIRELPRGGKPECMFLIKYMKTTECLVKNIIENPHADKKEIDGSVFSISINQMNSLLKTRGVTSLIQHKGIANLMLCNKYLKNTL